MELKVFTSQETLYLGLIEGVAVARTFWNGGIDSCLYGEIQVEEITVVDLERKEFYAQNYIVLDNGETLRITEEEKLFEYFIKKI